MYMYFALTHMGVTANK